MHGKLQDLVYTAW